ncbi:enamine deaminase RidA [Iodidimonas muriae]|uniref:Enamine deaminase RidA n=1 Tax=Iodidimonas muriae TaxID=261467 RepID=A0ABQ2LEY4_9PROT|nr:RidA family protein [Iodidimonas muriae]GER07681.1 enamine deaminase RidA [Kordiimonadales bacterium JCM 17843]GGO14657.1 enamine deaminase RidA [Iodidimonas muriae]
MDILLPDGWPRPKGYSNGLSTRGRQIFVAGQVGWDTQGRFPPDFAGQFRQILENTLAVLKAGDAAPHHIVRMTWYIVDIDGYRSSLPDIGAIYRTLIGAHYPTMTAVQVAGLVEPDALLEIETTAIVPD